MKKNDTIRKLSAQFLLSSVLLSILASCQNESSDIKAKDTDTGTSPVSETETAAPKQSNVPSSVDFGGTVLNIMTSPSQPENFIYYSTDSETGDVVNDAVYTRNAAVEEKLGVTLNYFTPSGVARNIVSQSIKAGDDAFDLVLLSQTHSTLIFEPGMFQNMLDAPYLNYSAPWWSETFMQNLQLDTNARYYVTGDITLELLRWASCCFYNKELYSQYFDDANEPYQMVLDGKWTVDAYLERSKDIYADLNQNNKVDEDDLLGNIFIMVAISDSIYMGFGGQYMDRDAGGNLFLNPVNEKTVNVVEKINRLFYEMPGSFQIGSTWAECYDLSCSKMSDDSVLFVCGWLHMTDFLRDMKHDYGIVPIPKYDESTKGYRAQVHDETGVFSIPTTTAKFNAACAYLEEAAYQSYKYTTPAYYDLALKAKYLRDSTDAATRIIDIIHDSIYTDIGYVFTANIFPKGLMHRELIAKQSTDYSSLWETYRSASEENLAKTLENYKGN